jgi:hypothetical protein
VKGVEERPRWTEAKCPLGKKLQHLNNASKEDCLPGYVMKGIEYKYDADSITGQSIRLNCCKKTECVVANSPSSFPWNTSTSVSLTAPIQR